MSAHAGRPILPPINTLTIDGTSVYPGLDASYIYLAARISIVGDVSIFVRGDSNGDQAVDLSDAQAALNHLFLGGPEPWCADAADVNDDGVLDIADPIHLLSFFFLGGSRIAPPYPRPGGDSSFDTLKDCPPGLGGI